MRVRSVMSVVVHACTAEQTLADAARVMWEHDVGCVPIVDAQGRAIAMLTDRDVSMAAYLRGVPIAEIEIASAMSPLLFTCQDGSSLEEAEQTMQERQVRRLPVVDDDGVLVGVLSLNDVVLARTRSRVDRMREQLRGSVITTLASISRHREQDVAAE